MTTQSQVWANVAAEYRRLADLPTNSKERHGASNQALLLAAEQADKMAAAIVKPQGTTRPTREEQNPSYRNAMRDAGRGRLLP